MIDKNGGKLHIRIEGDVASATIWINDERDECVLRAQDVEVTIEVPGFPKTQTQMLSDDRRGS